MLRSRESGMNSHTENYHRPADWSAAIELLRQKDAVTVPGLLGPRLEVMPRPTEATLVDLGALELAYIDQDAQGVVHIGALTPLQALVESPLLHSHAGGLLSGAARRTAHYGLRNVAVVGGALLSGDGAAEILLALLVLEAIVVIQGSARREVSVNDFLLTENRLQRGEMIVEVRIDSVEPQGVGTALERVGRTPMDQAIVAAAALITANAQAAGQVRLAVAGVGFQPTRVKVVERSLQGKPWTSQWLAEAAETAASAIQPAHDHRASLEYQQSMATVLARRALGKAWKNAGGR